MSDAALPGGQPRSRLSLFALRNRLARSRRFQTWAARFPLTKRVARAEGEALFDLVAGFCHSQMLRAVVELDLLDMIVEMPRTADALAPKLGLSLERTVILLRAATALGLTEPAGQGAYRTSRRGAALLGVPGLADMIRHHHILYKDLADPVAFLRGETDPELAHFWPYVFGEGAQTDPAAATRYSRLMADSQGLVAEETLKAVNFKAAAHVMDIGGGTGVFLSAVLGAYPTLRGTLFDLPGVADQAGARFADADQSGRVTLKTGNFRTDALPKGPDTITLIRVLYDHQDATVSALLSKVHAALPPGGRLIVSEPMSGGAAPQRAGDAYFALYCAAMGTGRTRSPDEVAALISAAGFANVKIPHVDRRFITSIVTADRLC
ncbi:MAG: methyltransferase [Pseudomonadota bacterium]